MKPLRQEVPDSIARFTEDRRALERDVLAFLAVESRSFEELLALYDAAKAARDAWDNIEYDQTEPWTCNIWAREGERAFTVMQAVADRLAETQPPDNMACRHTLIATLADWQAHCNDNPNIPRILLRLMAEDREVVERLRRLR